MTASAPNFCCPLCGATQAKPVYRFAQGDYQRCAACQLLSLYPMPSARALIELYDADYYGTAHETLAQGDRESQVRSIGERSEAAPSEQANMSTEGYAAYREQRAARTLSFGRYAQAMASRRPHARVLDVGCALGFFLEVALKHGLDAHGIDASEAAIASIRGLYGGRVRSGMLNGLLDTERARFDFVFASDVIEHVPEPRSFVSEVAALLKPNGEFWAITPNADSWLAKVSGERWVSLKPPEHVILYGPTQMQRLLEQHFTDIRVESALQEYPASLVAERVADLLGPLGRLSRRAGKLFGSRLLRVPDGNMLVRAHKR